MTKKTIRITQGEFQRMLNETVKKVIAHRLNEGFADREMDEKWIDAERQLGSENMLQEVYNYFDSDQLTDFLHSLDEENDLGLFDDAYEEEEDEELDADEPFDWQEYKG